MNVDIGGQKNRRDFKGEWVILDVQDGADIKHDLNSNKPIPIKDNSVDNIFCSHTLEHIEPRNIIIVLKDFYRVLKPNGKCRIIVPDVLYGIKLYLNNPKELSNNKYCMKDEHLPNTCMARLSAWFYTENKGLRTGHRIGFDEELLRKVIETANFKTIKKMSYNVCSKIFDGKDYIRWSGWSLYFEISK